jgi:hypothetical protein
MAARREIVDFVVFVLLANGASGGDAVGPRHVLGSPVMKMIGYLKPLPRLIVTGY